MIRLNYVKPFIKINLLVQVTKYTHNPYSFIINIIFKT